MIVECRLTAVMTAAAQAHYFFPRPYVTNILDKVKGDHIKYILTLYFVFLAPTWTPNAPCLGCHPYVTNIQDRVKDDHVEYITHSVFRLLG